jgi:hypothetical protein
MTERSPIRFLAGNLRPAVDALVDLAQNRLPLPVATDIHKILVAMRPYLDAFNGQINALVAEYGEDGCINNQSPNWQAFVAAAHPYEMEEIELDVEPISMKALQAASWVPEGKNLVLLLELGLIADTETPSIQESDKG